MNPVRSFDEKNVVAHPYDVRGLEHEEDVPCSWCIIRIVESDDTSNELRRNDTESSTVGDPTKHVRSSATVTLYMD